MKFLNTLLEILIGLFTVLLSFYACLKVKEVYFPDSDLALIISAIIAGLMGGVLTFKILLPVKDFIEDRIKNGSIDRLN